MRRNFTNEDFEHFLKRNADGFKMPPSEKTWKGIAQSLKEHRRKTGYATAAFLFIASLLGIYLSENSKQLPVATAKDTPATGSNRTSGLTPVLPVNNIQTQESPERKPAQNSLAAVTPSRQHAPVISLASFNRGQQEVQSDPSAEQQEVFMNMDAPESVNPVSAEENNFPLTMVDSDVSPEAHSTNLAIESTVEPAKDGVPGIENMTTLYIMPIRKNKLDVQFYFTPTVSYRKLSENRTYLRTIAQTNSTPNYAAFYDVNNAVTHKPDMGLEIGVAAKYDLSSKLKVRAGVQFNMNSYAIKAFNHSNELAMIALDNGSTQAEVIESITNYRNLSGSKVDWLQNYYFQVSAPVGLEFKIHGTDKASFGIAGTIQPTYMVNDRVYILSTDFKNYTEIPWLVRPWNVNTSIETFVSYSTGNLKWQIGPQVRYQLLSTFIDKYPVKENLFDFGLKVGVSLDKSRTNKNSE